MEATRQKKPRSFFKRALKLDYVGQVFRDAWTNRHGPKLKLFGPRYPNTIEFQRSPEGQRVYAEFDKINGTLVRGIGSFIGSTGLP